MTCRHFFIMPPRTAMLIRKYLAPAILIVFFWQAPAPPSVTAFGQESGNLSAALDFLDNGGFGIKKAGRIIASHNVHTRFVPASIIKVATSLAALEILGAEYRFQTDFFIDEKQNLYVKGYGDPFLVSEEVAAIARELKRLGCRTINDIYLDDTAFVLASPADGTGGSDNPYDAQNGGLAVNFNTVNLVRDSAGRVFSAEEQTPTLPLMAELAGNLEPGMHRINISHGSEGGHDLIIRYAGELLRAFLARENISGQGIITARKAPDSLPCYYRHRSSMTLQDIIPQLMLFSNNFIANQLFLTLGAKQYGYPATWEKSRKAVEIFLRQTVHLSEDEISLFEGSGLSRKNLVTPYAMLELLDYFKPYGGYLPLKNGAALKSGTLKGVYSYCGYFNADDRQGSFVLILNQGRNTRDRLLGELERIYLEN